MKISAAKNYEPAQTWIARVKSACRQYHEVVETEIQVDTCVMAALFDDTEAMYLAGGFVLNKRFTAPGLNPDDGRLWWRAAAGRGEPRAAMSLGVLELNGTPQNKMLACMWFLVAAKFLPAEQVVYAQTLADNIRKELSQEEQMKVEEAANKEIDIIEKFKERK